MLPLRASGDSCAGIVRRLLYDEAAGRSILRRPARSGPRARRLPLSGLRGFGSRETQDHHASSGAWGLPVGSDDLALSGLSCQGGADEDGSFGDDPLLLLLWREQHPEAQEQIMLGFDGLEQRLKGVPSPSTMSDRRMRIAETE
jgi:hypothetical protein